MIMQNGICGNQFTNLLCHKHCTRVIYLPYVDILQLQMKYLPSLQAKFCDTYYGGGENITNR